MKARESLPQEVRKPILLKLSPDLSEQDQRDVAEVVLETQVFEGAVKLTLSNLR